MEKFSKQKIETLCMGKFLALRKQGPWEYAERVNSSGAAIIVAVTPEHKLLLVEQYRIPVHCRTMEMPAGITGDDPEKTEEQLEAARRELLEETGFEAAEIRPLIRGAASSGLSSEVVTFFRASNLRRVHAGGGVEHEEITVHEVPLSAVEDFLAEKEKNGVLIDPKIYAGLYFLRV
jgi:ADP-ribose pyrophosphatase